MNDESPAVVPDHVLTPHARPIQPLPVTKDGQQFIGLRDPSMLHPQSMVVNPQALNLVQQFQGVQTIEEIASKFMPADRLPEGADREEHLQKLASEITKLAMAMDTFGLLWGPTFHELERKRMEQLEKHGAFPVQASASLVALARENDPEHAELPSGSEDQETWARELATAQLALWLEESEDPEFEVSPVGIVVPHLDYARGGELSASAYRAWVDQPSPARIVVLGTNHFGMGDGVVASPHGFQTPLGRVSADEGVWKKMHARLGDRLFKDQLDLVPEHSIEIHLPWIQHLFGDVPVVAALIPDPLTPMISDDGGRVTASEFTAALKDVLGEEGGQTYFISSADLSHVGPQFGEPKPVDAHRREEIERHDREMMTHFLTNDGVAFIEAMEWSKNPTRWCSIGNMRAVAELAQADHVELLDYRQVCDDKGASLVSAAVLAFL